MKPSRARHLRPRKTLLWPGPLPHGHALGRPAHREKTFTGVCCGNFVPDYTQIVKQRRKHNAGLTRRKQNTNTLYVLTTRYLFGV